MRWRFKIPHYSHWAGPLLVAVIAWLALVSSIDPGGSYPNAPEGPGLTFDESFNVIEGTRLNVALEAVARGLFSLTEVFSEYEDLGPNSPSGYHLPDHPPLGRIWIGLFHNIARSMFPPDNHGTPFVIAAARSAPATAFALTVLLIGCVTTRWYGQLAGLAAALSLVLMPRLFGHAHLASLESFIGLMYAASVLSVAHFWNSERPPGVRIAALVGFVWGLALLTKIQAVLIPVAVFSWALWRWRAKSIVPLLIWSVTGWMVFFIFWPWLWIDPTEHFLEYLGRTSDRIVIRVWYFGQQYADRDVPWHYPIVMFLTTVPIGLHLFAAFGFTRSKANKSDPTDGNSVTTSKKEWLVLTAIVFPLLLFSLPGITVYDGTRLFLMVFPLWGLFVGRGAAAALDFVKRDWQWSARRANCLFAVLLLSQAIGLVTSWPCHLSYYNALVGGTYGAERLGMEPTYWGDSLTRSFLRSVTEAVPHGSEIEFNPVMHQFYLPELTNQSPILRQHGVRLIPFADRPSGHTRYILTIRRKADLPDSLRETPDGVRILAEIRRCGVVLAALYECPPDFEL